MNPIFILGTGRSGTVTIANIFSSIYNAIAFHEGGLIRDKNRKDTFPPLTGIENRKVQDGNLSVALEQIKSRVDFIKNLDEDKIYVESNNFIWPYIPALKQEFPDLKIIHLIRDPYKCIRSLFGWPTVYADSGYEDYHYALARKEFPETWPRLKKICNFWIYVNEEINKLEPTIQVKLEDLDTKKINEILNLLNIESEYQESEVGRHNASKANRLEMMDIIEAVNKYIPDNIFEKFGYERVYE